MRSPHFASACIGNEPETDLVQALRDSGLSIGSADRPADAIEALRRAVIRGSLGVFVWHSGMSATVKLSDTALARLRMLDRRTFFLRTGHVRTADLADAGILGELARSFSAFYVSSSSAHFAFGWTAGRDGGDHRRMEILLDLSPLVVRQRLQSSNRRL